MKSLTGMGGIGSAADLAEMLRQMGRGRDTVLAHITPEEAELLMQRGGAGTTNPMTGLPEFQDDYFGPEFDPYAGQEVTSTTGTSGTFYDPQTNSFTTEPVPQGAIYDPATRTYTTTQPTQVDIQERFVPSQQTEVRQDFAPFDIGFGQGRFSPEVSPADIQGMPQEQFDRLMGGVQSPAGQTTGDRLAQFARENPRLVGYGAQGLIGALQASRLRSQTRREAERLRALGTPMREEGEALRQAALSGNLTPQQARQLEAGLARSRQAAVGRGTTTGTQEAMLQNVAQRTKADLLQTNLANSLKLLNLANAYDEAAIKAQLAADREADDLLADIFANIAMDYSSAGQRQQQAQRPQPQQQQQNPMGNQEITRRPDPRG